VGVQLAASRFGIVVVTPGEHVDPLQAGPFGDLTEGHAGEQGDRQGPGAPPSGRVVRCSGIPGDAADPIERRAGRVSRHRSGLARTGGHGAPR